MSLATRTKEWITALQVAYLRDLEKDLDGLWFLSRDRDLSLLRSLESDLPRAKRGHGIKSRTSFKLYFTPVFQFCLPMSFCYMGHKITRGPFGCSRADLQSQACTSAQHCTVPGKSGNSPKALVCFKKILHFQSANWQLKAEPLALLFPTNKVPNHCKVNICLLRVLRLFTKQKPSL